METKCKPVCMQASIISKSFLRCDDAMATPSRCCGASVVRTIRRRPCVADACRRAIPTTNGCVTAATTTSCHRPFTITTTTTTFTTAGASSASPVMTLPIHQPLQVAVGRCDKYKRQSRINSSFGSNNHTLVGTNAAYIQNMCASQPVRYLAGGPRPKRKGRYNNSKKNNRKKSAKKTNKGQGGGRGRGGGGGGGRSGKSKGGGVGKHMTKQAMQDKRSRKDPTKPPPAYLHPTASPHVYIASCAAAEFDIDPQTLFADAGSPPSFQQSQFEYVSPKSLGHNLPNFPLPEVCFLGKSNVGKSSLINALTKRKDLARISKRPGRTQQVNYFSLIKKDKCTHQGGGVYAFRPSESTGFLVDLPGYGYAAAPDDKVSKWQDRTQQFLLDRRDSAYLKRTYLLVDARHGLANFDRAIMGWFDEAQIPYSVVLTKADRVGRPQLVRFVNDVCMRYHSKLYGGEGQEQDYSQSPVVHITSSRDGVGIEELMWSIDNDFYDEADEKGYESHEDDILDDGDGASFVDGSFSYEGDGEEMNGGRGCRKR